MKKTKYKVDEAYIDRRTSLLIKSFVENYQVVVRCMNIFPDQPELSLDCIHLRDAIANMLMAHDLIKGAKAGKRWAKGEF